MNYRLNCETVHIKKWAFRIVNISRTGYYGVIIELIDFRVTGEKFNENAACMSSVIYEPPIKEKLELLRLNDLREVHAVPADKQIPWSLFFYYRDTNLNPKYRKKPTNIVVVDKAESMLRF